MREAGPAGSAAGRAAAFLLGAGGGGGPSAPPAAPAADARQVDAAVRAIEAYLAADKPSEAVFVAEKLAAGSPGLMRAQ